MQDTLINYIEDLAKNSEDTAFIYKTDFRTFSWSYSKLYKLANKFARWLEKEGLRKGDKLIIWAPNRPSWAVIFLGCILKGVILIPIDLWFEENFVSEVIRQTHARLIFCTKSKDASRLGLPAFFIEDLEYLLEDIPFTRAYDISIVPDDLVEIVYTSGTTAQPKGVMLSHKNLASNLKSLLPLERIDNSDTFLSLLPLSHVFEQMINFFLPLARGSSIIYLETLKASTIFGALVSDGVTIVAIVPRLLKLIHDEIMREIDLRKKQGVFRFMLSVSRRMPFKLRKFIFLPLHRRLGRHLRFFTVGGATLNPELEKFWSDLGFLVLQGYGLTETSPVITYNTPYSHKPGSVGKTLSGIELRIKEDGEILVKGDNVFSGYFKNETETAQAFEEGWFKTGDVGTVDGEGFLYLKDRKKDVIVTCEGLNIYPSDIEAVLNNIADVKDSCVLGLAREGVIEVHAALVLHDPQRAPAEIIAEANSKLPFYLRIQNCTVWPREDFPRTATMKIKKNEVKKILEGMLAGVKSEGVLRLRTTEKNEIYRFINLVSKMDSDKIKPTSRLGSDLGLDSIDRIGLVSMIEHRLHVDIDENHVLEDTTVAELEEMAREEVPAAEKGKFRKWTKSLPIGLLRCAVQFLVIRPLVRIFCRVTVEGRDNLKDLKQPVIFMANHTSHFDGPVIFTELPGYFSSRLAVATSQEYFQELGGGFLMRLLAWVEYNFVSLLFNGYLFPHTKDIRRSMAYTGELLDKNWNILFFPESMRTTTGKMLPFKPGIGLLASNMKVPIVPIKLEGLFEVLPVDKLMPRVGQVKIKIGSPLFFKSQPPSEITKKLEQSLHSL